MFDTQNGGCNNECVCQVSTSNTEYCISQFSFEDPNIHCETDNECPQGDLCQALDLGYNRCSTGTQPGNLCYLAV